MMMSSSAVIRAQRYIHWHPRKIYFQLYTSVMRNGYKGASSSGFFPQSRLRSAEGGAVKRHNLLHSYIQINARRYHPICLTLSIPKNIERRNERKYEALQQSILKNRDSVNSEILTERTNDKK
jgi:hypothetical protein